MIGDALRQFVEGAPLSSLDEATVRYEAGVMARALEVQSRRATRAINALGDICNTCDDMIRETMDSLGSGQIERAMGLGLIVALNNVASTVGHVRSWAMRSTREVE